MKEREESAAFLTAPLLLRETVRDLERRGLLQYDRQSQRHDLHPVVRSVVAGRLRPEDSERYGQQVVDHFSQQIPNSYEGVETIEELSAGLHLVRTLLHMRQYGQACDIFSGGLNQALRYNLEAIEEILSLLHPFFPQGWTTLPQGLSVNRQTYLVNQAARALYSVGEFPESLAACDVSLQVELNLESWDNVRNELAGHSAILESENHLAASDRYDVLELDLAAELGDGVQFFLARMGALGRLARMGKWTEAEKMWQLLDSMGRNWPRYLYGSGDAESLYAHFHFWLGDLTEDHVSQAEGLARSVNNRKTIRKLHGLRGEWQLEQGHYDLATDSLHEAVQMARATGRTDQFAVRAEVQLTLAKFHLGQLTDPHEDAERLAQIRRPFHRGLSELWLAISDHKQAKSHALASPSA